MLVYEKDGNVLALLREAVKCGFDIRGLGLRIHDEEVLLRVRWLSDVLEALLACCMSVVIDMKLTPTPANSMPVTVS